MRHGSYDPVRIRLIREQYGYMLVVSVSDTSPKSFIRTAKPHIHSTLHKIKVQVGDELFVCCLHRQQLDSLFQRTSRHLKGGVQGRRESQKCFSHARRNVLVFINPHCTTPPHLKRAVASTL